MADAVFDGLAQAPASLQSKRAALQARRPWRSPAEMLSTLLP